MAIVLRYQTFGEPAEQPLDIAPFSFHRVHKRID
jgi:hypothetical protein